MAVRPAPENTRSRQTFYLMFAAMGILMFWLFRAYLGVIAFSFITVIVLRPLYTLLLRWCRGWTQLAVMLTFVIGLALPLGLVWMVGWMVVAQAQAFINMVQQTNQVELWAERIAVYLHPILTSDFLTSDTLLTLDPISNLSQMLIAMMSWLASSLVNLGMSIPTLALDLFVYLVIVGALLPNYEPFLQWLKALSPLDDALEDLLLRKISTTVQSMFTGIFLIALVQGLAMGIFFWIARLPYAPLWTLVSIIAAALPLGTSVVAIPAAIAQFLAGRYVSAAVILAGYFIVVSNLDLLIRPRLVSLQSYGSFALMLLSLLGGYQLFGLFGFFYGPILVVLFLTMLNIHRTYFAPSTEVDGAPVPAAATPHPTPVSSEPA